MGNSLFSKEDYSAMYKLLEKARKCAYIDEDYETGIYFEKLMEKSAISAEFSYIKFCGNFEEVAEYFNMVFLKGQCNYISPLYEFLKNINIGFSDDNFVGIRVTEIGKEYVTLSMEWGGLNSDEGGFTIKMPLMDIVFAIDGMEEDEIFDFVKKYIAENPQNEIKNHGAYEE